MFHVEKGNSVTITARDDYFKERNDFGIGYTLLGSNKYSYSVVNEVGVFTYIWAGTDEAGYRSLPTDRPNDKRFCYSNFYYLCPHGKITGMKQRFYLDTSVWGGLFDAEFILETALLFDMVKKGEVVCLYSEYSFTKRDCRLWRQQQGVKKKSLTQ